jgi:hypothetical protein
VLRGRLRLLELVIAVQHSQPVREQTPGSENLTQQVKYALRSSPMESSTANRTTPTRVAALLYSLIASAKLAGVEPRAYLAEPAAGPSGIRAP